MPRVVTIIAAACFFVVAPLAPPITDHVANAQHQPATVAPVPLESLPLIQAQNMVVIPPGNSASFQGAPITHGLQGRGYAFFKLNKRYLTLSGTIYEDDNGDCSNTAPGIQIFDESNQTPDNGGQYNYSTSSPLYNYSLTQAVSTTTFSVNVRNVKLIILFANTGQNDSTTCPEDIVASLTPASVVPEPAPVSTHVQVISPTAIRAVPTNRSVLFQWHPFHRAAAYQLHAWLVHPLGNNPVRRGTPTTFATTVYGKTTYTWSDRGFLPGLYRYELLPVNKSGYALADWSPPTDFKIIG